MRQLALICLGCVSVVILGSDGFGQIPSSSIREAEVGRPGKLDGVSGALAPVLTDYPPPDAGLYVVRPPGE
jgi:hypothetical protein